MISDQEWFENHKNSKAIAEIVDPEGIVSRERAAELITKSKNGFLNWAEMMELPHEENNYLIDKFLWEGQVAMILAKEKVGKSILSKQMICSLTSGEPLFDEYDVSRKCNICYLQLEGDRGETKSRFKSMSEGLDIGKDNFFWRFYDKLHLDTDHDTNKLLKEIRELDRKIDVIFIDPVYMACSGSLSNDEPVRKMIGNIRKVQEEFNCSVILVHHEHRPVKNQEGKHINEGDNAIMGSFAFKAFVSHVIRVTKCEKSGTRTLSCDTQRNGGVESNVKLDLLENPLMYRKQSPDMPKGTAELVYKFIKSKKKGASAREYIEEYQTPHSTVNRAFMSLKKSGYIEKSGDKRGRGEVLYTVVKGKDM